MALTTWAGNHSYDTQLLLRPTTVEEVQEAVASSPRVRALGSRHSFTDLADSPTLLSLERLDAPVEIDSDARTARVGGGTRYGTLALELHRAGWGLHNLASLPHISVAGAVATATHGSGDRLRNLADAVVGLEVVTADGELLVLGPDDPRLPGAVVSLGAIGVVTALTLRVEPTYDVAQDVLLDVPWDAVLTRYDEITASGDSVSLFTDWVSPAVGQVWRKRRVLPGAGPAETDDFGGRRADGPVHPLPGVDPVSCTEQGGVPGPWHDRLPHFRMEFTPSNGDELQSEYLLPRRHAAAAIEAMRSIGQRVAPMLLVGEVRTVAADEMWLSSAYGTDTVGFHFTWRLHEPEVRALLPLVEETLAPFAARPHWGKVFTSGTAGSPENLRSLYPRWDDARSLFAELDPEGCFHNGFLQRHGLVG